MAEGKADVVFYLDKILVKVEEAGKQSLEAIAHQIEGQAKANVVANDQVDTGFMLNAIYVTSGPGTDYSQAKGGSGRMAPEVDAGEDKVAVVAGAEYSIFQEARNSFLFRAAEQVGGIVEKIGREVLAQTP